jgi:hypothetical protein
MAAGRTRDDLRDSSRPRPTIAFVIGDAEGIRPELAAS